MNKNLILIPKIDMTHQQWVDARDEGIGGSDQATLMSMLSENGEVLTGFNKYQSAAELYYAKIGMIKPMEVDNIASFMGNYLEDNVADLWSYHEGTLESMIRNYKAGNKIRKARRCNFIIKNPKYPWLLANVDRLINTESNPHGDSEAILEVKTIDKWAADQFTDGLPPYYFIQVQHYMLTTELDYSEICLLKSGRFLEVFPVHKSEVIQEQIIIQSEAFWNKVLRGRELLTEMKEYTEKGLYGKAEGAERAIDALAPPSDCSDAFTAFIKEKYKRSLDYGRMATDEEILWAKKHAHYQSQIKELEQFENQFKNALMASMKQYEEITVPDSRERVSWSMNTKGVRSFRNYFKP